jgi:hypothetical protein|tara:strand:+ start:192 stop:377 length:186 start_codon:yes stop_codon:yes gene_type:complete
MGHREDRIESLTRKWWALNNHQKTTRGASEWVRLEEEKDEVVELLAAFGVDAPPFPLEAQE